MSWAFAFFATFSVPFVLIFAFFIYVYRKEYLREERIAQDIAKAQKSTFVDVVYVPVEQIKKPKSPKKVLDPQEPIGVNTVKPKKDIN